MFTKSALREAIPAAIERRISQVLANYRDTDPAYRWIKDEHDEELAMARSGWVRWRPTELLGLPTSGPERKARNFAAEALKQLEKEGRVETFAREGAGRTYAVRRRR